MTSAGAIGAAERGTVVVEQTLCLSPTRRVRWVVQGLAVLFERLQIKRRVHCGKDLNGAFKDKEGCEESNHERKKRGERDSGWREKTKQDQGTERAYVGTLELRDVLINRTLPY